MADAGALRPNFQQLVDLLLVFNHTKPHLGVVQGKHAFSGHGILVERHGNRAQRLRGQHGGVQTRTVGAHHHQMFTTLQPRLMQATSHVLNHLRHVRPIDGLPNAVFLLAHGGRVGALLGMFE